MGAVQYVRHKKTFFDERHKKTFFRLNDNEIFIEN